MDFSALRMAYLSERVYGKVGVDGVDGAPAERVAGPPALSPAKLASNFARSAARLAANPRLDSLLYCLHFAKNVAWEQRSLSGGVFFPPKEQDLVFNLDSHNIDAFVTASK
jgi:hypothetical protein